MGKRINQRLQNVISSAAQAAGEARTAVQSVGRSVADKYDAVCARVEYARLADEQEDVFGEMGRMLYRLHTGGADADAPDPADGRTPRQAIDALLIRAQQLEQEMAVLADRLETERPQVCPGCGRPYRPGDVFCAGCGTRLDGGM